ncbi:MAG: DUF1836 domain-containing protein [Clostridia bacterium]|nr:DUF1836 domain-containing protein [Clostridia bacterium]
MPDYIPGTIIPLTENVRARPYDLIDAMLVVSGGLTLSQVSDITGLNGSTIQNWVKRGWVESPKQKRYGETSLCRIMIINMLRGAMRLEEIVRLMSFINGRVDDRSDDIIPDRELFTLLCAILTDCAGPTSFDMSRIDSVIERELAGFTPPDEGSAQKLKMALSIMVFAYMGTLMKKRAEDMLSKLEPENRAR